MERLLPILKVILEGDRCSMMTRDSIKYYLSKKLHHSLKIELVFEELHEELNKLFPWTVPITYFKEQLPDLGCARVDIDGLTIDDSIFVTPVFELSESGVVSFSTVEGEKPELPDNPNVHELVIPRRVNVWL